MYQRPSRLLRLVTYTAQVLKVFVNQLDVHEGKHVFLSSYFGAPALAQCHLECAPLVHAVALRAASAK